MAVRPDSTDHARFAGPPGSWRQGHSPPSRGTKVLIIWAFIPLARNLFTLQGWDSALESAREPLNRLWEGLVRLEALPSMTKTTIVALVTALCMIIPLAPSTGAAASVSSSNSVAGAAARAAG